MHPLSRSMGIVALVIPALLLVACASLPQLTFEGEDAGSASDGATLSTADAGGQVDASNAPDGATPPTSNDDSGGSDAGLGESGPGTGDGGAGLLGCPLHIPTGADACCLTVPCVGKKCTNRCPDCAVCTAGEVCCVPNGNAQAVTCPATLDGCK